MFHGLFGVKDVDSVYWSLEVELLFYAIMLGLWIVGWIKRPLFSLSAWIGLQLVYAMAKRFAGVSLPYTLSHMLVLPYIPYFGVGMIVCLSKKHREIPAWQLGAVFLLALGVIALGGDARRCRGGRFRVPGIRRSPRGTSSTAAPSPGVVRRNFLSALPLARKHRLVCVAATGGSRLGNELRHCSCRGHGHYTRSDPALRG